MSEFQLHLSYNNETYDIPVTTNTTIAGLKPLIEIFTGVPQGEQDMQGIENEDYTTLKTLGLEENPHLKMTRKGSRETPIVLDEDSDDPMQVDEDETRAFSSTESMTGTGPFGGRGMQEVSFQSRPSGTRRSIPIESGTSDVSPAGFSSSFTSTARNPVPQTTTTTTTTTSFSSTPRAETDFTRNIRSTIDDIYEHNTEERVFLEKPFHEAVDAARRTGKLLFIFLYSSKHDVSMTYLQIFLSQTEIIQLLRENFLMWICDMENGTCMQSLNNMIERNPQVNQVLQSNQNLPIVAIASLAHGGISFLHLTSGEMPTSENLMVQLLTQMENNPMSPTKGSASNQDDTQKSEAQLLRERQDQKYLEALQADKEKMEREAREKKEREEKERLEREKQEREQQEAITREREIDEAKALFENLVEPESGDLCAIRMRLPDGNILQRRFTKGDTFAKIYQYLMAKTDMHPSQVTLETHFPKKSFEYAEYKDVSLQDAKLGRQEQLFVVKK